MTHSDEALREGEGWLYFAWAVTRTYLARRLPVHDAAPKYDEELEAYAISEQNRIDDLFRKALAAGEFTAFARDRKTGEKLIVEALRWKAFSSSLVVRSQEVGNQYDEFRPFSGYVCALMR